MIAGLVLAVSLLAVWSAALLLAVLGLIRKIRQIEARLDGVGVRVSWLEGVARGAERMRDNDNARPGGRVVMKGGE